MKSFLCDIIKRGYTQGTKNLQLRKYVLDFPKGYRGASKEEIEICLHCTKPTCNGCGNGKNILKKNRGNKNVKTEFK